MDTEKIIKKLKPIFTRAPIVALHKEILISKIIQIRYLAALQIQRHIRGYLVRKEIHFMSHPKIALLLKWISPAGSVHITGNFTNPPWESLVPMHFSKFIGCFYSTYFLENRISSGRYYLKFIVDGDWLCNERMGISEDLQGNLNNVIEISKNNRYVPRAHSTRNLVPESLSMPVKKSKQLEIPRISSFENNLSSVSNFAKEELNPKKIKLSFGSYLAAHPISRFAPLERTRTADALFTDVDFQIFGIADGVGEWETFGLNPGFFPNELLDYFKSEYIKVSPAIEDMDKAEISKQMINCLDVALRKTRSYGSSTVLLAVVKDNFLITLSIGDSGFVVFRPTNRDYKVLKVFRSQEQQHAFNCPFQLACFPSPTDYEKLIKKGFGSFVSLLKRSNLNIQDLPEDARIETLSLFPGDIVITATDGLFDNLFDADIQKICEMFLAYEYEPEEFCQKLSRELVTRAVQKGWDSTYKSPFSKNAAIYGQRFIGGKLDDTSVIVALVSENK